MTPSSRQPYIVAVYNQKGGIAKTTTSINLATCLSAFEKSVLVVDLDPQGNATKNLCPDFEGKAGIYDLISGQKTLAEVVTAAPFPRISVLPSTLRLAAIEADLGDQLKSQRTISEIFTYNDFDFDFVIIDCPPALGLLSVNALVASHAVIMPVTASPFAYDGLQKTWSVVEKIRGGMNKALTVHGILLTLMESDAISRSFASIFRNEYKHHVYRTEIPKDHEVVKASVRRLPSTVFNPHSSSSQHFLAFAEEFLARQSFIERRGPADSAEAAETPPNRDRAFELLQEWQSSFQSRISAETDEKPAPPGSAFAGMFRREAVVGPDRSRRAGAAGAGGIGTAFATGLIGLVVGLVLGTLQADRLQALWAAARAALGGP
jgi:chromosome partitioning protein